MKFAAFTVKERFVVLSALALLACPVIRSSEPVPVAGTVEKAPANGQFATHFLRAERAGKIIAGLRDPRALLPVLLPSKVILQATQTGRRDVNGFPLLDVDGVLPEAWAQPASRGFFVKGPGAFSGFGRDAQIKDFAGVPFEELRAYETDNGIGGVVGRAGSEAPPLGVREVGLTRSGIVISWDAVGGIRYQLLTSPTPDGPYRVINEVLPSEDGDQTFTVTLDGAAAAFFRILASEP